MYYITTAFKGGFGKFLAGFFAVAIILALGFMGCMVQSNSIGSTFETAFGVPSWIMGIVLVGHLRRHLPGRRAASGRRHGEDRPHHGRASSCWAAWSILVARIQYIPATFGMIFKYAFQPQAIIGGGFGYALKTAISQGAKRGLFSNEAGMGSTPHAHAQANVADPHDQGVVAMIGVFIDTFVVLTLNALVIISTLYTERRPSGRRLHRRHHRHPGQDQPGPDRLRHRIRRQPGRQVCGHLPALLRLLHHPQLEPVRQDQRQLSVRPQEQQAVQRHLYHHRAGVHLPGHRHLSNDLVWELTDMFNNLMVIPNAIALFALTGMVIASLNEVQKDKLKV